jgi:hypothetical protein
MAKKDKSRLLNLFKNIGDKDAQEIIANVVLIEQQNRTGSKENFPRQKVRDVIDAVARKKEMENN